MTGMNLHPTSSQNPDPQEKPVCKDDITHSQEQQTLPERLPQSLIEWLARTNRRYLALNQEKTNDSNLSFKRCFGQPSGQLSFEATRLWLRNQRKRYHLLLIKNDVAAEAGTLFIFWSV